MSAPQVFEVDSSLVRDLNKTFAQLRDKKLLALDRQQVTRIELARPGEAAVAAVKDTGNAWSMVAPQAGPARSVQVCACNDVDEDAIVQALRHCEGNAEDRLSGLQAQLRCGTSCGSCLPAVKALLRRQPAAVAAS